MQTPTGHFAATQPHKLLLGVAMIACLSLVVGTVLPGFIADKDKVFRGMDIRVKIREQLPQHPSLRAVVDSEDKQAFYHAQINEITQKLLREDSASGQDITALLALRAVLERQLSAEQRQFTIRPFFLSNTMLDWPLVWSAMYTALGIVSFLLIPRGSLLPTLKSRYLIVSIVTFYFLYQAPTWLNSFLLSTDVRRVFSSFNIDISLTAFVMQEVNTALLFGLVFLLWKRGLEFFLARQQYLRQQASEALTVGSVLLVSDTFLQWQVSSIVLGLGFICYTGLFWNYAIVLGDHRYLVSAVVLHIIWLLSWWIISLPLLVTWEDFSRKKLEAILGQSSNIRPPHQGLSVENIAHISPVSLWSGIGSVAAVAASLALPIIHALRS
jgi:hypothetical protein